MILRQGIVAMMALCFTASSVLADEVLYCTDSDATGFKWDKDGAAHSHSGRPTRFTVERYTIKVVSETERIITRMVGDTAGSSNSVQVWSTVR